MKTSDLAKLIRKSNSVRLIGEDTYQVGFSEFSVVIAFNPDGEDLKVGFNNMAVLESASKNVVGPVRRLLEKKHKQNVEDTKKAMKLEFDSLASKVLENNVPDDAGVLDLNNLGIK